MNITDFGVNVDALPKLVLNEDAGRTILKRLLMVRAFRDYIDMGKRVFFAHYLHDHLEVETNIEPGWPRKKFVAATDRLMADHELVWNSINTIVDRHVFLMVTAYASVRDNVLNSDDLEYTDCRAYINTFFVSVAGALGAMETADALITRIKRHPNAADVIETTMRAKETIASDVARFEKISQVFMIDAMDNKEYFDGTTPKKKGH